MPKKKLTVNKIIEEEISSIKAISTEFVEDAVSSVLSCKGKVILTGMGKAGIIAKKISATLSSTGTPSVFMHPSEAQHGDLGILDSFDMGIR